MLDLFKINALVLVVLTIEFVIYAFADKRSSWKFAIFVVIANTAVAAGLYYHVPLVGVVIAMPVLGFGVGQILKPREDRSEINMRRPIQTGFGENGSCDIILEDAGIRKIHVIKFLRYTYTIGLKQAKDLVMEAPVTLRQSVSKSEADYVKAQLEEIGAKVQIRESI